jgi:hypothetical protein
VVWKAKDRKSGKIIAIKKVLFLNQVFDAFHNATDA